MSPVVIDIITHVKDASLKALQALLIKMQQQGTQLQHMGKGNHKSLDDMNKQWLKFFQKTGAGFNKLIGMITKFTMVQTGVLGVALAGITAAFKVGQLAVKGWNAALAIASGAAAAAMAVLTGFFAAQREYQGAMAALNYSSGPLGARQATSTGALQQIQTDSELAVAGLKGVQGAFQGISKSTPMTGDLKVALKAMGDFAVASGDLQKGMATAGEFLGLLQKEGKLTAKVQQAGMGLGIEFQDAMKTALKQGKVSSSDFLAALNAGELNSKVVGLLDGVSETLMGRIKAFGTEMMALFTDLGQAFLPEAKAGFEKIKDIARGSVIRIAGSMQSFASGPLIDTLVKATDKIANFVINLFDKYLPKTEGMLTRIGTWLRGVREWFRNFIDAIRPLKAGGQVIIDMFKPIVKGFLGSSLDGLKSLSADLVDNKVMFVDFGDAVGKLFRSLGDLFTKFRGVIIKAMPTIISMIKNISRLVSGVGKLFSFFGGSPGKNGKRKGGSATLSSLLFGGLVLSKVGLGPLLKSEGFKNKVLGNRVTTTTTTGNVSRATTAREGGFGASRTGQWLSPRQVTGRDANGNPVYGGIKANTYAAGGLAIGAMFASPEAQPYLAGGAAASYLIPGKAGLVAGGLVASGAALTSKTAAGGVMTGAAAGGTLGLAAGPWGAAIGAIIGGLVGGIAGAINNGKDEKKRARDVGLQMGNALKSQVVDGMNANVDAEVIRGRVNNDFGDYGKRLRGFVETQNKYNDQRAKIEDIFSNQDGEIKTNGRTEGGADTYNGMTKKAMQYQNTKQFIASREALVNEGEQKGYITSESAKFIREQIYNFQGGADKGKAKIIDGLLAGVMDDMNKALDTGSQVFGQNLINLASATGMTGDEVTKLASEFGVSLYDETLNVVEAMKKMGIQIPQTVEEFKKVLNNNWIKAAQTAFDKVFGPINAQSSIDQQAEAFRTLSGPAPATMIGDLMKTIMEQAAVLFPDDMQARQRYVKGNIGVGGVQFSDPNSPLYGREREFTTGAGGQMMATFDSTMQTANASTAGTVLMDYMNTLTGGKSGITAEAANQFFAGKSIDEQTMWVQALTNRKNTEQTAINNGDAFAGKFTGQAALDQLGLGDALGGGLVSYQQAFFDSLTKDQQAMYTSISNAIKDANEVKPGWYTKGPSWWTAGFNIKPGKDGTINVTGNPGSGSADGGGASTDGGDTMTSRLGLTMARHAQLNRMVTGKRTVTSSWRNTGLGSINSDHVTGNAYDLTGQNLGSYARLVNGTGGFAEFHGHGGGRHLHVVPGPGLPMGDTATPMLPTANVTTPPGSSTFHITVNGAQASPEQIAMVVMQRIEQKQRSVRERS